VLAKEERFGEVVNVACRYAKAKFTGMDDYNQNQTTSYEIVILNPGNENHGSRGYLIYSDLHFPKKINKDQHFRRSNIRSAK
jgi:hypothetical protein